jgi:hypothetical protein
VVEEGGSARTLFCLRLCSLTFLMILYLVFSCTRLDRDLVELLGMAADALVSRPVRRVGVRFGVSRARPEAVGCAGGTRTGGGGKRRRHKAQVNFQDREGDKRTAVVSRGANLGFAQGIIAAGLIPAT